MPMYCRNCARIFRGGGVLCGPCAHVPVASSPGDEDGLDETRGQWVLDRTRRVMVWEAR